MITAQTIGVSIVGHVDKGMVRRRRQSDGQPRVRQVVVRFSDVELAKVCERAAARGMAVGAWIGEVTVRAARDDGALGVVGHRELLRELVAVRPGVGGDVADEVDALINVLVERLT